MTDPPSVAQVHTFGKGMGIAAPQIGIERAAAIVRTPDGEAITLLNPAIIESGGEVDHLHGQLYTDRMREGVEAIPVKQYRGTDVGWKY